ncbi:hypothetical protein BSQ44_17775 [Aquibium oceanicum]|uniref:Putative Flp pilus-assembly TadG-like N-terminal domain-containing protein n=1 Tax=Aquibium oceanicum TaxID=1670800 RepID=A0A1L3SUE8_9HYPH|nr:TadE/TadG family type IV pilus assembly protein [Aquibium oceanicum]APH73008.1 hypothetical protein BSQ44_17775 [Aquibium oceanicum]
MFRKFLRDVRGDYAIATAVAIIPILGSLALAVDYTELSRERAIVQNALDAAGIAAARYYVEGASKDATTAYAKDFFLANLNGIDGGGAKFTLVLPNEGTGGGVLTISATHSFKPFFLDGFTSLIGSDKAVLDFQAETKVRLKNTLEVALVLDNSGSMDYTGSGSGKKRIVLLRDAAKQLVSTLAAQADQLKQVDKPVQFSLVPFAASVNVGPSNATAAWMDVDGRSPIHHEDFDWTTMPSTKKVQLSGGIYYKKGADWGAEENQKVTRFTMFNDVKRVTGKSWVADMQYVCTSYRSSGSCRTYGWVDNGAYQYSYGAFAGWQGCVEARPYPYNLNDAAPLTATPATLFVPMFAPDETDQTSGGSAPNSWWVDVTTSSNASTRQKYMPKYFTPAGEGTSAAAASSGPNDSCTTKPITALVDVSVAAGKKKIEDAIDAMTPLGATNVPEGLAWGWRTVSHDAPFTEGRVETEKGNDKVVIVLTDGANTYYTPSSLGYADAAANKSTYSAYGYTGLKQPGESYTRMFMGTTVGKTTYSNDNYTSAMTQQMNALCESAKAKGIIVMTVSLDLSTSKSDEKAQIDALKACSSNSRFRNDSSGSPAKLYWNATGANLSDKFKEIADELSNLRIVG